MIETTLSVINDFIKCEEEMSTLISEAWEISWKDVVWNGGSYIDALKKSGLHTKYSGLYETQNGILAWLGIERLYGSEGYDETIEVIKRIRQILETIEVKTK